MKRLVLVLLSTLLVFAGCTDTRVARINENKQIDLSGNWNDTDIKIVSDAMIKDCLKGSWMKKKTKGSKPVVIIGMVENRSSEHIDTTIISKKLEAALMSSGRVITVADFENRGDILMEREYQEQFASKKTSKNMKNETGADYMLLGSVKTNLDQEGNKAVRTYYVDLALVSVETGEKVWMQEKTVKKYIEKNHFKF
ncbi:MAG: penicillin-binding protein activator LpoB [Sphaerochaetaceae bacterium]